MTRTRSLPHFRLLAVLAAAVFSTFVLIDQVETPQAQAAQAFIPYDDFNAGGLDSGRWGTQELLREILGGALFSRITQTTYTGSSDLIFMNP